MATTSAFILTLPLTHHSIPARSTTIRTTRALRPRSPHLLAIPLPKMATKLNTDPQPPSTESKPPTTPPRQPHSSSPRYLLIALYVSFTIFAFFLAPGSPGQPNSELSRLLAADLQSMNDLFLAIFFLMGAVGVNYAALLNPGASRQKRPFITEPFTLSSIFIGFISLGPYLIARAYVPAISANEVRQRGLVSRVLENRWLSVGTLLFSLWCYGFSLGLFTPGGQQYRDVVFYASSVNLMHLISTDRFVSTTCADFVISSLIIWGPLTEDMSRRGWFVKGKELESALTALSFMLIPVLGPALYLVTRSPLPEHKEE